MATHDAPANSDFEKSETDKIRLNISHDENGVIVDDMSSGAAGSNLAAGPVQSPEAKDTVRTLRGFKVRKN